jgi:uncharacterized Zn finger protein (UPF0148 family)
LADLKEITCPACHGTFIVKKKQDMYYCPYCGSTIGKKKEAVEKPAEAVRKTVSESRFEQLAEKQAAKQSVSDKDRFTQKYDMLALFVFFMGLVIGFLAGHQTGSETVGAAIIIISIVLAAAIYIKGELDYRKSRK